MANPDDLDIDNVTLPNHSTRPCKRHSLIRLASKTTVLPRIPGETTRQKKNIKRDKRVGENAGRDNRSM